MNVSAILNDPVYPDLKRHILGQTGLAYYADKDEDLASRIARRVSDLGVRDCASYLARLMPGPGGQPEMNALIGELTIGETYFFRQRTQFDLLRDTIIPDMLERNGPTRQLRIWSAGCANGAEPYSIAILLRLEFADRTNGWDISIVGTDLNVEFLARARAARFDQWAFREMSEDVKARCFVREGNRWALRPEFQSGVTFQQHNLIGNGTPPAGGLPFDLVLCRNVMIYFDTERVRRTVQRFYDVLAPGGWLLVGHAEPNPEFFQRFRTVYSAQATAYQKEGAEAGAVKEPAVLPDLGFLRQPKAVPGSSKQATPRHARVRPATPAAQVQARPTVEDARAMADRGRWREAADLCRKLIRSDALNTAAHFTLGVVLEHAGERGEAVRELRKAIYLDRGFALAHYHLGTVLQSGGQAAQARKAFGIVLDLLAGTPAGEPIEHGDGVTVAELADLARMHLEVMGRK